MPFAAFFALAAIRRDDYVPAHRAASLCIFHGCIVRKRARWWTSAHDNLCSIIVHFSLHTTRYRSRNSRLAAAQ
jgi:hypothetical protein